MISEHDKPSAAPAGKDNSYTAAGDHTTAAAIGKQYLHEFPPSDNPDKSPLRSDDGELSSGRHAQSVAKTNRDTPEALRIEFHHPLEKWLGKSWARTMLKLLTKENAVGDTALERIIRSYRNPAAPAGQKLKYWAIHKFIDRMRGDVDAETFRKKLADHTPTVRGLVIVARSHRRVRPDQPQKFTAPLFAVWNFTNRCNLACKHCYQDSERKPSPTS
jgi:uncharacterized radical SAM superfamily Fe-S cluster-containing enzyme